MKHILCTLLILFVQSSILFAQYNGRIEKLQGLLEDYSKEEKNLNKKIDIAAFGSVQEIVSAIAQQTKINITIDPTIQQNVVSNFTKVKVLDILLFLCQQYNLDVQFTGSIISIIPYQKPIIRPPLKEVGVYYNKYNSTLSLDLDKDTLGAVVRKITQQSGKNVIVSPQAQNQEVNGFIDKLPVDKALKLLSQGNNLYVTETPEGAFLLRQKAEVPPEEIEAKTKKKDFTIGGGVDYEKIEGLEIVTKYDTTLQEMLMDIKAVNVPFKKIIKGVSIEMGRDYFLFDDQGTSNTNRLGNTSSGRTGSRPNNRNFNNNGFDKPISLKLEGVTYDEFLKYILQGTALTYKIDNEIYLIGDRSMEGLRLTKTIQLQYRSANEIETLIPEELKEKVQLYPFLELNAIVLSGSAPNIMEIEAFIRDIDKLVPVVQIELIIIDVQRNRLTEGGIQLGVGEAPVTNERIGLSPGFDIQVGASTINKLLASITGQTIVNLGAVVPNFYLSLKAVEDVGIIKTRSRPQLATLNSHKASFKIGETRYYQESRTTVQGVQGTVTQQDINFIPVQADFSINVTPYVSGDEQITLEIEVEQSDFLSELQLNAPPPQVTRKFDSKIRVKNGDMIALGGLENDQKSRTGRGIPGLARVPVLNWFGNRRNSKSKSELIIFIKPTIIY